MIFSEASQQFMEALRTRSTPCRRSTIKAYESILRTHLNPRFGNIPLDQFVTSNNRLLRELVRDLRDHYAAASMQLAVMITKQIIESPKNENGLPLYDVRWANDFIDAPAIANQKQPTVAPEQVSTACADVKDGNLYFLLAASGLRISEALGLVKEDYCDGAVHVRQGKTDNAARFVDLASGPFSFTALRTNLRYGIVQLGNIGLIRASICPGLAGFLCRCFIHCKEHNFHARCDLFNLRNRF